MWCHLLLGANIYSFSLEMFCHNRHIFLVNWEKGLLTITSIIHPPHVVRALIARAESFSPPLQSPFSFRPFDLASFDSPRCYHLIANSISWLKFTLINFFPLMVDKISKYTLLFLTLPTKAILILRSISTGLIWIYLFLF